MHRFRIGCMVACIVFLGATGRAADIKTLLVLPFTIHAEKDMSFLQAGLRDMLASRLSWKDHVVVLDRSKSEEAWKEVGKDPSEERLKTVGTRIQADYILFGSMTILGGGVSLDAKVFDVPKGRVVRTFFRQIPSLDQVIPQVDAFARELNSELFRRSVTAEKPASPPPAERSPSLAKTASSPPSGFFMTPADKIQTSALNPNIVRGGSGKPVFWQSTIFPFNVRGFDIGDVDGDGKNDLVAITDKEVRLFKMTKGGLAEITHYTAPMFSSLLTVDVADLTEDGMAEIYVANETGAMGETQSFVLEVQNGRLVPTITKIPWYFRIIKDPENGEPMLVGQRKKVEGLEPRIYELRRTPHGIVQGKKLTLPSKANVFNFTLADLNNDGKIRVVLINKDDYLEVTSRSGDSLWESDYYVGGTMNYLTMKAENAFTSEVDERLYIPARILVADLDEDGLPEIIVNRNKSATYRLMSRYKFFSGCQIISLSWKGFGLMENWSTKRIPGYVPDLQLKDLDNDGKADLVVVMVKLDPAGIMHPKSTFMAFQLATDEARQSGR